MRYTKGRDANMKFLFGSVFFFFILLVIISMFCYFSLQKYWFANNQISHDYNIAFSKQFNGRAYDLYLNDSLIYEGNPVTADTVIRVSTHSDENALLVVDKKSDAVSILEIERNGSVFIHFAADGTIAADVIGQ